MLLSFALRQIYFLDHICIHLKLIHHYMLIFCSVVVFTIQVRKEMNFVVLGNFGNLLWITISWILFCCHISKMFSVVSFIDNFPSYICGVHHRETVQKLIFCNYKKILKLHLTSVSMWLVYLSLEITCNFHDSSA